MALTLTPVDARLPPLMSPHKAGQQTNQKNAPAEDEAEPGTARGDLITTRNREEHGVENAEPTTSDSHPNSLSKPAATLLLRPNPGNPPPGATATHQRKEVQAAGGEGTPVLFWRT